VLREGTTVELRLTFVADYAVWGQTATGEIGIVPLDPDADEEGIPAVGARLRVRVVRLLDPVGQEQHSDLTFDGHIRRVSFVGVPQGEY
jgi:hypothetical protein